MSSNPTQLEDLQRQLAEQERILAQLSNSNSHSLSTSPSFQTPQTIPQRQQQQQQQQQLHIQSIPENSTTNAHNLQDLAQTNASSSINHSSRLPSINDARQGYNNQQQSHPPQRDNILPPLQRPSYNNSFANQQQNGNDQQQPYQQRQQSQQLRHDSSSTFTPQRADDHIINVTSRDQHGNPIHNTSGGSVAASSPTVTSHKNPLQSPSIGPNHQSPTQQSAIPPQLKVRHFYDQPGNAVFLLPEDKFGDNSQSNGGLQQALPGQPLSSEHPSHQKTKFTERAAALLAASNRDPTDSFWDPQKNQKKQIHDSEHSNKDFAEQDVALVKMREYVLYLKHEHDKLKRLWWVFLLFCVLALFAFCTSIAYIYRYHNHNSNEAYSSYWLSGVPSNAQPIAFNAQGQALSAATSNNSVNTYSIQDGAVTSTKLAGSSVVGTALSSDAYQAILNNTGVIAGQGVSVANQRIVSVQTDNNTIGLNSIGQVYLKNGITTSSLADNSVTTSKLVSGAITKDKIASDVAGAGLQQASDGSLTISTDNSSLIVTSFTNNQTGAVSSNILQIASHGVSYDKLSTNVETILTTASLQAQSAVNQLSTIVLTTNSSGSGINIVNNKINMLTDGTVLAVDSITGALRIGNQSITNNLLQANSVSNDKLDANLQSKTSHILTDSSGVSNKVTLSSATSQVAVQGTEGVQVSSANGQISLISSGVATAPVDLSSTSSGTTTSTNGTSSGNTTTTGSTTSTTSLSTYSSLNITGNSINISTSLLSVSAPVQYVPINVDVSTLSSYTVDYSKLTSSTIRLTGRPTSSVAVGVSSCDDAHTGMTLYLVNNLTTTQSVTMTQATCQNLYSVSLTPGQFIILTCLGNSASNPPSTSSSTHCLKQETVSGGYITSVASGTLHVDGGSSAQGTVTLNANAGKLTLTANEIFQPNNGATFVFTNNVISATHIGILFTFVQSNLAGSTKAAFAVVDQSLSVGQATIRIYNYGGSTVLAGQSLQVVFQLV